MPKKSTRKKVAESPKKRVSRKKSKKKKYVKSRSQICDAQKVLYDTFDDQAAASHLMNILGAEKIEDLNDISKSWESHKMKKKIKS